MSAFFIPHNCWHDWALLPKYLVSVQFILTGQVGGNSCICTVHCKCLQYLQGLTGIHREPLQSVLLCKKKKNVEWKGSGSVARIEEYQFRGIFVVFDIFWKLQFLNHFVTKIMPIFQSPPAKRTLICQIFFMKKCYFPLN